MVHPALATVLVVIFLNLPATSFAACPAGQKSVASTQITNFCNTGSGSGDECYCMTQHSAMSGCPGINSCTYPPYYPDVTRARAIASLYIQHICRCPEKGGLDHWYNSGKTIAQIEADIVWIVNNERNNCACPSPKNWNTLLYRCTACPSGQYNDGSMNTYRTSCITTSYCSPRTTCGAGTYASSGSASANTVCSTCSSCGGGTYESSRCTSTSNRQCKTCSTCSASQYEISACTSSSNRQCSTCRTCGGGTYTVGGCSGSTNRICSACLSCSSSQYETSACTSSSNRQCAQNVCSCSNGVAATGTACTTNNANICTSCYGGYYKTGNTCNKCRSACLASQYETSACTASSNRQCATCQTCGSETYSNGGCSGSTNQICSTCLSCTSSQYETSACTSSSNRQCTTCLTCGAGTYHYKGCEGNENRQCETCSTCSASQYETSACTASSNRQCATCQTCGSETYSNGGCSGSTNRICSACLSCSSSQYETSACTATANRQCATCQTCGLGTYSSGGCTGTENRQCSTCLTCSAAEYETVACTATSNRQCVAYPTCAGFGSSCGATKHLKSSPGSITCASSTCEISECCNPNPTCNDFNRPVDDTSNDNDNDQGGSDDSASSRCDNGFHMKNNLAFICESNICSASECCELNVCVCPTAGGNGHSGTSCEEHDTTSCSSCPYGHKLSSGGGGSCVACIAGQFQEMRDFTGTSCSK